MINGVLKVVLDSEIVLIQYTNNLILHIKIGISYKLDKNSSIGIGSKFKRGDSQYNSIGISYKVNF